MDRYVVVHHPMTHQSVSWLIVNLPCDGKRCGSVVSVCPSKRMAETAAASLNETQPNRQTGVDDDTETRERNFECPAP